MRLILALSVLLATRAQSSTPTVVHEERAHHPSLTHSRRLEGHVIVPLKIGLKQRNIDSLAEHLMAVSDPQSPSYAQHWSPDKVAEIFAPANETADTVGAWLEEAGFAGRMRLAHNKAWIHVENATVDEVEQLIGAEYHVYSHESGEEHVACDSYSLPGHIAHHIEIITPTVQPNIKLNRSLKRQVASSPQRREVDPTLPAGCDQVFTPACIRALYNITYVPQATDRNSFGIVSQATNTYLQSDLDIFFGNFSPSLVGKSPLFVSIDGGVVDVLPGTGVGEDGWILQYSMSLVAPQNVSFLQVGDPIAGDFISFNEWLDAVDGSYCTSEGGDDFAFDPQFPNLSIGDFQEHSCGTVQPPYVISNSRADFEYRLSPFYERRQCNEFAKLGLMGVTVLFSAGNFGAAGTTRGYCLDDNGSVNLNATHFNPGWPAACPWITSVGGTQVKANVSGAIGGVVEEVWNQDLTHGFFEFSGGGFSNRFQMPEYQKDAVSSFLARLKKTNSGQLKHFNAKGSFSARVSGPECQRYRNNFIAVEEGVFSANSGTSGATPTVASIITLVNDARLAAGKKPIGFINPSVSAPQIFAEDARANQCYPQIYSPNFAGAFNDIISGTSQGCKGWQGDRGGGFQAGPGWDAASGVGTPNLGLLIEKWLELP
ncbi:Pro-kumamolisin, activation domain-containing protein [Roridomyces roridus]|uniref:Pro-kumamolisin, activation domain-containing protein n=1 Tax=Roridomyces roridus TaxID=1738132 RepID=A0AAD7C062_9AGAR|nr:Pro-kumamolisin, activation domain-containing protein [Roridomyces roridus]